MQVLRQGSDPGSAQRRMLAFACAVATGGCYVDMRIGTEPEESTTDADGDADADADSDGPDYVCHDWRPNACLVDLKHQEPPPSEIVGEPVPLDAALHSASWTWTALQADRDGRLYAFYWWVPSEELDDPQMDVVHLAWRTRAPGATEWSEVHAVSGVTSRDLAEALCEPMPSSTDPVQFVATDDGYVHAFWRKIASCRSGDTHYVDHVMFQAGELVYREPMPIACSGGRHLAMTDALAIENGGVMVAFVCGSEGKLQTFSCGCWSESTLVGNDENSDGSASFLAVQDDIQLANVSGEPWIVIRDFSNDLWARRLSDPALPESYLHVSDEGNAVGSPVVFADDADGLWVAWQAVTSPSTDVRVAALVDGAFEPPVSLPGGAAPVTENPNVEYSGVLAIDGAWVRGLGPMVLTEETLATGGTPNVVEDDFFVRTFADGVWSEPRLAASNESTFGDHLARHTASDLEAVGDAPALAYEVYVGGDAAHFELRVSDVDLGATK